MDVVGCLLEKTGHKTENNNNHAHAFQSNKNEKKKTGSKKPVCFAAQTCSCVNVYICASISFI